MARGYLRSCSHRHRRCHPVSRRSPPAAVESSLRPPHLRAAAPTAPFMAHFSTRALWTRAPQIRRERYYSLVGVTATVERVTLSGNRALDAPSIAVGKGSRIAVTDSTFRGDYAEQWARNTGTAGCSNTCNHAEDGDCDDGGPGAEFDGCDEGTDCLDCGIRTISSDPQLNVTHIMTQYTSTDCTGPPTSILGLSYTIHNYPTNPVDGYFHAEATRPFGVCMDLGDGGL